MATKKTGIDRGRLSRRSCLVAGPKHRPRTFFTLMAVRLLQSSAELSRGSGATSDRLPHARREGRFRRPPCVRRTRRRVRQGGERASRIERRGRRLWRPRPRPRSLCCSDRGSQCSPALGTKSCLTEPASQREGRDAQIAEGTVDLAKTLCLTPCSCKGGIQWLIG
jgi:hypothetical protein